MNTTPPPPYELFTIFGRTKGYLLTEQTAHDAVDRLAEVARDITGAAEGAGVSLLDRGGKRLSVGATDPGVLEADNLQYELGEGPCLSAWSTGVPVYITDTRTEDRWSAWVSAAAEIGVRSCLSVPLMGKPVGLGALKVYSNVPYAFSDEDQKLLVNLASSAAALLGHIQASDTPQRISSEVKAALAERDTVGVARGILMERFNLDRQAALNQLIDLATDAHITIGLMAAMISERQDGYYSSGDA